MIEPTHPGSPLADSVSLTDIKRASRVVSRFAHRTPVTTSEALNRLSGNQLFFKCENLQKAGAFKFRGAIHALSQLTPEQLSRGVVTHSSGNHAGALALAAKIFQTTAHIVMPENAIAVKRDAVLEYGGKITSCESTQQAREETAARIQTETGATMIPPFDDVRIIAGQGTCALEFLLQVPNLDFLIAPVGGGGLLSGSAIAAKMTSERIRVIGAEPAGADDARRSMIAGERQPQTDPRTIADGLRTGLGELTWPLIRDHVQRIVTVSEQEILDAMILFMERTKLVIEPSAAVAFAVVMQPKFQEQFRDRNIGIILSGGNMDLRQIPT
jgi:threonine dehydratase